MNHRGWAALALPPVAAAALSVSAAETADSLPAVNLREVTVAPSARHQRELVKLDMAAAPVKSAQELLRVVPGLFIAQHAGGGKAEQLFLRGFDLDHGTDISISVDGMPVNMVSHAHGQGYADLHFVMPELIAGVDFDKGPYDVAAGDLATAGYVAFTTVNRVADEVAVEAGTHGYRHYRSTLSLMNDSLTSLYVAGSFVGDDGYFDSPQDFSRFNAMAKLTRWGRGSRFSLIASCFNSTWNASGQIPERAVDSGLTGWFGSLDPSEGGSTTRVSLQALHRLGLAGGGMVSSSLWAAYYRFNLWSNFTFYLNNPVDGDEINQRERRLACGGDSRLTDRLTVAGDTWKWLAGVGFRHDAIGDLALYGCRERRWLSTKALGDVGQTSMWAYAAVEMNVGRRWTFSPGARVDRFNFSYLDKTAAEGFAMRRAAQARVSPKLNIIYEPRPALRLVAKVGRGFHSNDARVVVTDSAGSALPAATGADLGLKWKPSAAVVVTAAAWWLHTSQEMVYVGDEAVVEPSGPARRLGLDLGLRLLMPWGLYLQADYTFCRARFTDAPRGADRVPLAPVNTLVAGLSWNRGNAKASLKGRWLGDRPADESGTLTAKGYFIVDLTGSYTWRCLTLGATVDNLFNSRWREAQFATTTRLAGEDAPLTDVCFTPGTPLAARAFVVVRF